MYRDVVQWSKIRHRILVQGRSIRRVASEKGIDPRTIRKMLDHALPQPYGPRSHRYPKLGPHTASIRRLLRENAALPPEDRLSVKDIYERVRDEEGFRSGYSIPPSGRSSRSDANCACLPKSCPTSGSASAPGSSLRCSVERPARRQAMFDLAQLTADLQFEFVERERLQQQHGLILRSAMSPGEKDEIAQQISEQIARGSQRISRRLNQFAEFPPFDARHALLLDAFAKQGSYEESVFILDDRDPLPAAEQVQFDVIPQLSVIGLIAGHAWLVAIVGDGGAHRLRHLLQLRVGHGGLLRVGELGHG
jgi:hypothetical protein